jgi:S-adenosylmethionine:tRNA ribosyltransferase-isomerase
MLVVEPGEGAPRMAHETIAEFPKHLRQGDVVVINDTRVIPARLYARPRGNMTRGIELLLTRQVAPLEWETWCRPAKRVKPGDVLVFSDRLQAEVREKRDDAVVVRFVADGDFWTALGEVGVPPLPPYIRRAEPRAGDVEAYQTVYADRAGAIAAPTAGLHFTPELLDEVAARAELLRVTLHVGIGTFKPVKVDDVADHRMDAEWYDIPEATAIALNAALRDERRIIAVGTTSVRTLESAMRAGNGTIPAGSAETSIFITPGFDFQVVGAMLTNFHLPESTLMMLISAFAGMQTIRTAYAEAIREKYLFYSFGDCMSLSNRGSW